MNIFNLFDKNKDRKDLWRATFGDAYYQNRDYDSALKDALEAADEALEAYDDKFS